MRAGLVDPEDKGRAGSQGWKTLQNVEALEGRLEEPASKLQALALFKEQGEVGKGLNILRCQR